MRELLREIWATSKRNKLRTSLTGFAVAWGIFMIIFLLGAGNGLINAQLQQQNRHISNSIAVYGGSTTKAYKGLKEGRNIDLKESDLELTQTAFTDNIDDVTSTVRSWNLTVSLDENYFTSLIEGVYPATKTIEKIEILHGRFINEIDIRDRRKAIVISRNNAKELKKDYESLVGQHIKVGTFSFLVVGIYKDDESNHMNNSYAPFTTIQTIYAKGDRVDNIMFSFHGISTEQQSDEFEQDYRTKVNLNHSAAPDDNSAIHVWNRFKQSMQMQTGIGIIQTALWIIGLFTLLSGIVGVSNIMLITVKERTHEFGIRKAIGAKPWSILRLIMVESVIITGLFGYIGILCGIIANEYMDATIGHEVVDTGVFQATMFVNPTVGLDVCIEVTAVIIIAGTLAGLIPAWKAAHIRPIEALRNS